MKGRKKIILGLLSLACIGSSILPLLAKGEAVYSDYDADRSGSITLYKYVNNDNTTVKTDGSSLANNVDEQLDALQNATGNYKMLPEKGVEFAYIKVADAVQVANNNKSGIYYTNVEADFLDKMITYGGLTSAEATADIDADKMNEEKHYEPTAVTTALENLEKARFTMTINGAEIIGTGETYLREKAQDTSVPVQGAFAATNEYGKTKVDNIYPGLYMIAEVNWEHKAISKQDSYWETVNEGTMDTGTGSEYADIVSPSSPFLMQLPVTNLNNVTYDGTTYKSGEGWIYDVSAYPKNGTMGIHKDFITNSALKDLNNDGYDTDDVETLCDYNQSNYLQDGTSLDEGSSLTHQLDANIGDTVAQVISADVPALLEGKKNKTFKISDRMTKGLEFKELVSVTLGQDGWDGNNASLEDDDYTFTLSDDRKSFDVELTEKGLEKLDALQVASYMYVRFNAFVTKDALIGTDTYEYDAETGETVDATNQNTAKLTYATDRTMEHEYYSNTPKVYTYEIDINKTFKKMTDTSDLTKVGFQVQSYEYKDALTNQIDLKFVKEDDGIYHIYNEKYDIGSEPVDTVYANVDGSLKIKGLDSRDYIFTEVSTDKGQQLMAEPFTVRMVANKTVDESDVKFENGSLLHAYIWSGDEPHYLDKHDIKGTNYDDELALSKGIVNVSLLNNSNKLLNTGGEGNMFYYIAGCVLLGIGAVAILLKKREKSHA